MSSDVVIAASRLVDGTGSDGPGWLRVRDGVIVERGQGEPTGDVTTRLGAVVPGFLDMHVHGALGVDFGALGADPAPAIAAHARRGSTTLVASLATGPLTATADRLRELAPIVHQGGLAGLHLEGPFLSSARAGAHDRSLLRAPERADLDALLTAADGTIAMVTLAPELPGAFEAIAHLVDGGVVVALGHTDASADEVRRAIDAGATVITHLFNGMPPLHHRHPGLAGVALTDERVTVELIADGHHVDDVVIDLTRRAAGGRLALVSDAMSATGLGDGRYDLAGSIVDVHDGIAELADGSSLAGSTTPVGDAVARLLRRGIDLAEVVSVTSAAPARALDRPGHALAVGSPADLVEIVDGAVARVLRGGALVA
ncbi:N-acetylglucosamine-6-phosphate deacetylase [Diaminobutyricimonas aerilata]|uniref:N-acetylglucosamine-6-phosphate deacetylase n=1 Tax=Diaminobutyricimonas aerilata TaxID=1162967 RepID=A0A2M9CMT8_9MICO|nr:amidohydrolase family protein [Diaminobutyricimonas aerilata]PJJ73164.1 N-acetylglucosamine-6-phosphate deacetylase [Diaminobutyricimonas aerilata]